MKVNILTKVCW